MDIVGEKEMSDAFQYSSKSTNEDIACKLIDEYGEKWLSNK